MYSNSNKLYAEILKAIQQIYNPEYGLEAQQAIEALETVRDILIAFNRIRNPENNPDQDLLCDQVIHLLEITPNLVEAFKKCNRMDPRGETEKDV